MKGTRTEIYLRAVINMFSHALHVFHNNIVHFPAPNTCFINNHSASYPHFPRIAGAAFFQPCPVFHFSVPIAHAVCYASCFDGFAISETRQMVFLS